MRADIGISIILIILIKLIKLIIIHQLKEGKKEGRKEGRKEGIPGHTFQAHVGLVRLSKCIVLVGRMYLSRSCVDMAGLMLVAGIANFFLGMDEIDDGGELLLYIGN